MNAWLVLVFINSLSRFLAFFIYIHYRELWGIVMKGARDCRSLVNSSLWSFQVHWTERTTNLTMLIILKIKNFFDPYMKQNAPEHLQHAWFLFSRLRLLRCSTRITGRLLFIIGCLTWYRSAGSIPDIGQSVYCFLRFNYHYLCDW